MTESQPRLTLIQNAEKDLGDGLFLRWSKVDDQDRIAQLLGTVFRDSADEPFNTAMADWARLCSRDDFPFSSPDDWAIVEDRSKPECPIVACTCLWCHRWLYAGIPFGVGRPEFVATDPTYRNRGLIRAIFGLLHEKSEERGDLMQAITGIPYFYRLFDYEYVLDLGGGPMLPLSQIAAKKEDEPERFSLRLAVPDDLSTIMQLYQEGQQNSLLWHKADEAYWKLMINFWEEPETKARSPFDFDWSSRVYMVLEQSGQVCGYVMLSAVRNRQSVTLRQLVLNPSVNLYKAIPSIMRSLQQSGAALPCPKDDIPFRAIELRLGHEHPAYDLLGLKSAIQDALPYAWYIRVPDVLAFMRRISPILENRLAHSFLVGHTGELKVDLYRSGFLMRFDGGKIAAIEPWRPALYENPNAGCPPLIFLQLLLGYRSLSELRMIFPDVWARKEATFLLNVLFPKVHSLVHPLA